ncbi:TPA: hypothetical protein ACH3X3_000951 [Trebouxia sp. C0006]
MAHHMHAPSSPLISISCASYVRFQSPGIVCTFAKAFEIVELDLTSFDFARQDVRTAQATCSSTQVTHSAPDLHTTSQAIRSHDWWFLPLYDRYHQMAQLNNRPADHSRMEESYHKLHRSLYQWLSMDALPIGLDLRPCYTIPCISRQ